MLRGLFIKVKSFKLTTTIKNKLDTTHTRVHGHFRLDGYNYIKYDENSQQSIITRENEIFRYWKNFLNPYFNQWQQAVYSRQQIPFAEEGEVFGNYIYSSNQTSEGYDILVRKDITSNRTEVVFDLKSVPFVKNVNNCVLKTLRISPDHKKIGFIIDLENNEKYYGGIYNIEKNEYYYSLKNLSNISYIEFTHFDNMFLYVKNDSKNRPYRIISHIMSSNFDQDKIIIEETDPQVYIETNPTKDNKYIIINSMSKNDSHISLLDLSNHDLTPITIFKREVGVKYFVEHCEDSFYILSNFDKKQEYLDFKLYRLKDDLLFTDQKQLTLLIEPENEEVFEDMDIYKNKIIIYLKKELVCNILIFDPIKNTKRYIEIPEKFGEITPCLNKDYYAKKALFEFTNPLITKIIYELDLENGILSAKQKTRYTGKQIDNKKYELKLHYAPTKDGEMIPITIFHLKNLKKDRKNKCLLLGYGAYGLNLELTYNSVYLEAVERGWVIAYCHIRGGNELGKHWHKQAILQNKSVSIDDFIACAYEMVQLGYTHPSYMAACGQSSGGGVVAQAVNREPSLFRAVILSHPFVDILSTLLDESLPLTVTDYQEYGNPLTDRNIYFSMLSYSPFENISHQEYPAILINMSEDDPRVPSFGILKYIEKLRKKAKEPSRLPNFYNKNILTKIYKSGHFGPVDNDEFIQHKIWEMMWLDKMLYEKNLLNE